MPSDRMLRRIERAAADGAADPGDAAERLGSAGGLNRGSQREVAAASGRVRRRLQWPPSCGSPTSGVSTPSQVRRLSSGPSRRKGTNLFLGSTGWTWPLPGLPSGRSLRLPPWSRFTMSRTIPMNVSSGFPGTSGDGGSGCRPSLPLLSGIARTRCSAIARSAVSMSEPPTRGG